MIGLRLARRFVNRNAVRMYHDAGRTASKCQQEQAGIRRIIAGNAALGTSSRLAGLTYPCCTASWNCDTCWWQSEGPVARMDDTANVKRADRSGVQVIARAAEILRALEEDSDGLSLGQLAQRTGLARSTVQRIVSALHTEKLVIAASPTARVMLGPAILRLAGAVRSDFLGLVKPLLSRLSAELKETVDLAMVRKDRMLFVDQVVGPHRLRTVSAVGDSFPLYCTANGKAYLALLDDRAVRKLIGQNLEARTPNTITDLGELLKDLERARKVGVAFDHEEHTVGISAAGIALYDSLGNPMAISVPVPTPRFEESKDEIVEKLLDTKEALLEMMHAR
jgi:DNA-binding IclR family transcriptional regulator